jgi:hypothetical protein
MCKYSIDLLDNQTFIKIKKFLSVQLTGLMSVGSSMCNAAPIHQGWRVGAVNARLPAPPVAGGYLHITSNVLHSRAPLEIKTKRE